MTKWNIYSSKYDSLLEMGTSLILSGAMHMLDYNFDQTSFMMKLECLAWIYYKVKKDIAIGSIFLMGAIDETIEF